MNTTTSCSKPVKTIILNDFKRFWILSLAEFLLLFIATSAIVIMYYSKLDKVTEYIFHIANMSNLFINAVIAVFAILAAVTVFRYLHLVNSATVCHSMPITRKQLYIGHLISGYLLAAVPVIINSIILMIIAKPVYYSESLYLHIARSTISEGTAGGVNIFTAKVFFINMLMMLVTILFIYAVSVFAGMLCGTSSMHIIGAIGLNILVPALLLFICEYAQIFLYGFAVTSSVQHTLNMVLPVLNIPTMRTNTFPASENIPILPIIIYIAIAVIIILAGYFLYKTRKLENAGEPLAFRFMVPIVCGLLTFFASTLLGLFAERIELFFVWLAAGTFVFYILSRMLTLKTTRVFNKQTFKSLGIYAVAAAIFISIFAFDFTGYENRIPQTEDITAVSTDIFTESSDLLSRYAGTSLEFTSDENKQNMISLHNEFLAQKQTVNMFDDVNFYPYTSPASCRYKLTGGRIIVRDYDITDEFIRNSKALKAIYESDEFKDKFLLTNSDIYKNISKVSVNLYSEPAGEYYPVTAANSELAALIKALDNDFISRTFEQENNSTSFGSIEIACNAKKNTDNITFSIPVLSSDKNTLSWLKKHGYYSYIDTSDYIIEHAQLSPFTSSEPIDVSNTVKGMSLDEYLSKYNGHSISDDVSYNVYLELKRKNSTKTYSYDLTYTDETLPDIFK